jgi:predicted O-methyltransferase YrrM
MQYSTTPQNWRTGMVHTHPSPPTLLRTLLRWGARHSKGLSLATTHGFESGLVYDYIYRDQREGLSKLGHILDHIYLNTPRNRALRSRKHLLQEQLLTTLLERRKQHLATHILDLASGTGRSVLELLAVLEDKRMTLTCIDQDEQVLEKGRTLAAAMGLSDRVTFIKGDALDREEIAGLQPDIVVVSGWYELLPDDAAVCRSLMDIRAVLPANGLLLFTNHIWHPRLGETTQNPPMSNTKREELSLIPRPQARMERWAREAGFREVRSSVESFGYASVTLCVG